MGSRLIDKHRFCLNEMQECFETYTLRKDQAEQVSRNHTSILSTNLEMESDSS